MKSIREIITDYRNEILRGNLLPQRAAEILTEMSALLGNLNDEITAKDMAYNAKLLDCYKLEESANRAKIVAGTTEEYKEMRDARNIKEVAIEIIRSLKFFLKGFDDDRQSGKYQQ